MKRNMFRILCGCVLGCGLSAALTGCKNGDAEFDDFEGGTTTFFAYQYPVRTIVLGDDDYDTTGDKAGKCQIQATFGGSYNGSNGTVEIAVDPTLCDGLTFEDGSPVTPMPSDYYTLSTTSLQFKGTFKGIAEVQLTDAFFNDAKAAGKTYVIPVVMVSQTGFGKILTGTLKEGGKAVRTDASQWDVQPMDYVLYCVKFQNKYSGYWLTNGNTSTDNIEKAGNVQIKCRSLNESVYTVSFQQGDQMYSADLLLTFSGDRNSTQNQCTITSLTDGVTASGNGTFTDNGEKASWGNKDRDLMELSYTVDFGGGVTFSRQEKLVWYRSGIKTEEFVPVYVK